MLRAVGLRGALAINVCAMIGAGPLITIPLVVTALGGSVSVVVWIAGALIALCDGLVFAELASAFPRTGGTYAYLREAFGARGPGRLIAFLFVWQYLFWAPLVIASGYVGFAQYAGYLAPWLASNTTATHGLAALLGVVTLAAVWRAIPQIARTATILGVIAVGTLLAVALAGFTHPHPEAAALWRHAFDVRGIGLIALGSALVIVIYDYSGYGDVTALGEEVIAPERTLPRSIALAVAIVGVAYLALNLGVFTAVPAAEVAKSTSVASLVVERSAGRITAAVVTVAVLVTAFASTYGLLVAAARIPFAAARDGDFLGPFARMHPTLHFPHVALATIGIAAILAAFLPLDALIAALTAGIALVQGAGQCVAVGLLRAKGVRAPYRLPLFPLPPLVALAAWIALFASSGTAAMIFGSITLAAGGAVFLVHAARVRAWPFAVAAAVAVIVAVRPPPAVAATTTPSWGHAAIVTRDGEPQLHVDGAPFFFWGGAFFYERIPPSRWREAMRRMRVIGANTLDLYVPWNWHEVDDGTFDFDGHTNPRRNLREVLRLAREFNFHLIVRPGPVIRNEWRNGGYPAWLLTRPEYDMPLGDILDGRYAATATFQNAHGDDAAAQWMGNATHMRYAARWLQTALREFAPVADLVLAVQLDDDQGAYIDNQTVPAPNLVRYLSWLEAQSRVVIGPVTPAFINTFQMRVPSLAPVWTMGNWYQSDADVIGEHDRTQLDVSTAMLESNARGPLAQSEFQAGWLAGAEDPLPRRADPSNTQLALHELLALGSRGIIDFPMIDTLAPFGWEAPWSNALYAWDAAIALDGEAGPRLAPTRAFGADVTAFGTMLAASRRHVDAAIVWTAAAATRPPSTAQSAALLARATELLRTCRRGGLVCRILGAGDKRAAAAETIVVPSIPGITLDGAAQAWLSALRRDHRVTSALPAVSAGDDAGVTLFTGAGGNLVDARNWSDAPLRVAARRWHDGNRTIVMQPFVLPPRSARLIALDPQRTSTPPPVTSPANDPFTLPPEPCAGRIVLSPHSTYCPATAQEAPPPPVSARRYDVFEDGGSTIVMQNDRLRVIITPEGGGRVVDLSDGHVNATDATGAVRDGATPSPPPSSRDYIAPYTHDYPAGTAQRPYVATIVSAGAPAAVVRLTYTAPDLSATFERMYSLQPNASRLVVDERITGAPSLVSRSSLPLLQRGAGASGSPAIGPDGTANAQPAGDHQTAFAVSWRPGDVTGATWTPYRSTGTLALTLAPGWRRVTYALAAVADGAAARRFAEAERAWVRANPGPVPASRGSGGMVDATASKAVE